MLSWVTLLPRPLSADHVVEPGRRVTLPLFIGVLIDQRGFLGGLAGADHRVLEGGA